MPYSAWKYFRTLIDANETSLTDHVARLSLSGANFDFARALSSGGDIRFWDMTDNVPLPHWIKSYDANGEAAQLWVRLRDASHAMRIYYGHPSAGSRSNGAGFFNVFRDFTEGSSGNAPPGWTREASGTGYAINSTNTVQLASSPALSGDSYKLIRTTIISTGTGDTGYTAARVPHQRCCFTAHGRKWLFWADYSAGGTVVRPFQYRTSADGGETWGDDTDLGTIPGFDTQWGIRHDRGRNKIHVWRMLRSSATGPGSIFHDGLEWRQGTPNVNGTIAWDADWQTVNAIGNANGDPSIEIASDGHVWFAWDNGAPTAQGEAQVVRNANTDGTWSMAPGFPKVLTSANLEDTPLLAPIEDGKMYVGTYRWATDRALDGYIVDVDGSVTSEGAITDEPVEANSGSAAQVGRVDMASYKGEVHIAYQTSSQEIHWKKRYTNGSWSDEYICGRSWAVQDSVSSPRLSFDREGGTHVMWDEALADVIYWCRIVGESVGEAKRILIASELSVQLEGSYGHLMPAEEADENGELQVVWLDHNYGLRHSILNLTPANVTQSLKVIKSTTNQANHALRGHTRIPDYRTGYIHEFDLYVAAASQNNDGDNNDNLQVYSLSNSSFQEGVLLLIYGDAAATGGDVSLGYFTTGHNKGIAPINFDQWYEMGVPITGDATYNLIVDGSEVANNIAFRNAITPDRILVAASSRHTGTFYLDNLRVRPWAETEPSLVLGEEHIQQRISPLKSQIIRGAR